MFTPYNTEDAQKRVLLIPCPECAAVAGQHCICSNGKVRTTFHWERWDAYKTLREQARQDSKPINPELLRFANRFFDALAGRSRLSSIESELAMQAFVRMPQYGYVLRMHHKEGLTLGEIQARIPSSRGIEVRYQAAVREFIDQVLVVGARWYPEVVRSFSSDPITEG